jgi:PAS domain S-box-containing protein
VNQSLAVEDLRLLEQLETGIVVIDGAGIIVRWNAHADRILGLSADEAVGRPWSEVVDIVGGGRIGGNEVRLAAMQPGGWHGLTKLRMASTREVWVRAHVQVMKLSPRDTQPSIAAIFWPDPGPTDQADDSVGSLLPYRDLFRRSAEALLLVDLAGTILDANDAAAELHGRSREEMIGHSYLDDIEDWTAGDTAEAQSEAVAAGSIMRVFNLRQKTGPSIQVEAIGTLVSPTERGHILVRMRDLSRTKAREQMLRDLGGLARHSDEQAIGRLAEEVVEELQANTRMSEGLQEATEHGRRLSAELRAIQELTLLGASTDDLTRLAQETIEQVVLATGATGGGYILVDPTSARVDPVAWVGLPSRRWSDGGEPPQIPGDWPPLAQLQSDQGIWLARSDGNGTDEASPRAQAVLPLRVDDRLAGVLHLEWSTQPRSDQFDVHFFEPIARICGISLANFRLRSELLHRAAAQRSLGHRLDTLDELTRIGEEASSFEELAHRTVSLVREALGASGVCYLLIEPGHHFETHAVAGETGAFRLWLKGVPAKDAPGGSLLLAGGSSVLGDFVASQVNERVLPLARATGFRSFGAIPIRTGEELPGALLCFFEQPAASLPLDESALDSVARIAGIALANYRLRERLVSSEERYRTLFEESPDAVLVSALDGTVLDANEAAVRLYRVNRGEVLGRYFGQLIFADEREMARRRQIVWAQGRGTFRDRGRRPDGSEFPVEVEVRVVELGGQRRFLHLVRDLSDQERLQRELLQAQKMEAIGQLVSGVAHELNNPLAAIIAFSQLLRSDERLPDDMKHDVGLLVQEAERTRRIVQNLLDFARTRPPERRPTSIAVLVQSVLELQSYALGTNQIQVKVDIPATLPEVDLDRAQLQQVLLNLTINAIQAMRGRERKSPAHLSITATLVKTKASGVSKLEKLLDDQARVRISVRDDGPGVPESARARLFDPFFTTKRPGEGTGLGLSVSFGIVAGHGGHLWYEPGPGGVGSSFILELPVTARMIDERRLTDGLDADGGRDSRAAATSEPTEPGAGQTTRRSQARGTGSPATAAARPSAAPEPPHAATKRAAAAAAAAPVRATAPTAGPAVAAVAASTAAVPAAAPPTASAEAKATSPAAPSTPAEAPPATHRPRVLALDDEPSIRAFLRKALAAAGMDCMPYQDGAEALGGVRDHGFDVMLIDHRMAGMSGTEFYDAAIEFQPDLARRAVFMSGDVLNPDLLGFATRRGIRLLAKPFDIDAVIRVVREVLADADQTGLDSPRR